VVGSLVSLGVQQQEHVLAIDPSTSLESVLLLVNMVATHTRINSALWVPACLASSITACTFLARHLFAKMPVKVWPMFFCPTFPYNTDSSCFECGTVLTSLFVAPTWPHFFINGDINNKI
jgi:hypothetical protein